jgi:hypothetical protein
MTPRVKLAVAILVLVAAILLMSAAIFGGPIPGLLLIAMAGVFAGLTVAA